MSTPFYTFFADWQHSHLTFENNLWPLLRFDAFMSQSISSITFPRAIPGQIFRICQIPTIQANFLSHAWPWASPGPFIFINYTLLHHFQDLKSCSKDPFLRIQFLLVPKNWLCEHIKNDLPSNGSVIYKKKRMEIEHALFSSDTLLETWKVQTYFAWSFWHQIEDSLLVLKKKSCDHTTNDLLTFLPQKQNLEIRLSERLLPVFRTKNWILKNGSSDWALNH